MKILVKVEQILINVYVTKQLTKYVMKIMINHHVKIQMDHVNGMIQNKLEKNVKLSDFLVVMIAVLV